MFSCILMHCRGCEECRFTEKDKKEMHRIRREREEQDRELVEKKKKQLKVVYQEMLIDPNCEYSKVWIINQIRKLEE